MLPLITWFRNGFSDFPTVKLFLLSSFPYDALLMEVDMASPHEGMRSYIPNLEGELSK